jgi:hypothetical protein
MKMKSKSTIKFVGRSILRAWEPGLIPRLIAQGHTLRQSQQIAMAAGALRYRGKVTNLIVTVGLQMAIDWMIDVETTGLTIHSIGTGTAVPALADTTLGTEQKRKLWTTRSRVGTQGQFSVFYLGSESNHDLKEAGTFGGASAVVGTPDSGKLWNRHLQPYDNSGGSPNDLTYDYEIDVQEG